MLDSFPKIRELEVGDNRICFDKHFLNTYLHDGKHVTACQPFDTDEEAVARAWALAYNGNLEQMTRDHDPLHTILCVALGLRESPTLRAVAEGWGTSDLIGAEEEMVLAAQRFINLWRNEHD